MKTIVLALFLLAGVNTLPSSVRTTDLKDARFADIIQSLLDVIIELATEADPYHVPEANGEYNFVVDNIFSAVASVEDFLIVGFSNIEVDEVSVSRTTLTVDLRLPKVTFSVGNGFAFVKFFTREVTGQISGSVAVSNARLVTKLGLGLTGYFVDDLSLEFELGTIDSAINARINERDISNSLNNFLGNILPTKLEDHREEFNNVLANIVMRIIGRLF